MVTVVTIVVIVVSNTVLVAGVVVVVTNTVVVLAGTPIADGVFVTFLVVTVFDRLSRVATASVSSPIREEETRFPSIVPPLQAL